MKSIAVFVGVAVPSQKKPTRFRAAQQTAQTAAAAASASASSPSLLSAAAGGAASEAAQTAEPPCGSSAAAAEAVDADAADATDTMDTADGGPSVSAEECVDVLPSMAAEGAAEAAQQQAAAALPTVDEEPVVLLLGGEQKADLVRHPPLNSARYRMSLVCTALGNNVGSPFISVVRLITRFVPLSFALLSQPAVARYLKRARKAVRLASPQECVTVFGAAPLPAITPVVFDST